MLVDCWWLPASLCHRMTDRQEFSNPDQALSSGGSHLVMLAPESEVLPGQVSSSLFGGLKARGGSVRDLHLHLHAAGPATVAVAVCPEAPVSLHSSISASKLFPKAACQWCVLPKLGEDNVVWGECVWAEVILAAAARDWSCSQSCAQAAINASGGVYYNQVSRAVNDQTIIFRSLNNLFMMNESRKAQYFLSILHFPIFLTHN